MQTCAAVTASGGTCRSATNLRETPDGLRCIWHDPQRRGEAQAARSRGGKGRAAARGGNPHRFVAPEALPERPLDDIEAVVAWLVWLARITVTGVIDPATSRETNRILVTLKAALDVRTLKQEVRELRAQVKAHKAKQGRP